MRHVFWFAPGRVAGRSGPSKDPWSLHDLRSQGIGAVLSVNDGLLCHPEDFTAAELRYGCHPLSANAPPEKGDFELCLRTLPLALEFVLENECTSRATLVHCHSGKDRTGLFLAYYALKVWQMSPAEAMSAVRATRSIAFTAHGWDDFAFQVLSASGAPLKRPPQA